MTSEEISKIGTETTENTSKVKIPVAEYRNLIEAVATLKGAVEIEKNERWNVRSSLTKAEEELELYKEFVSSERDIRERFYDFCMDKEREAKKEDK